MVYFLSSFLEDCRNHLIPIYEIGKKKNIFEWTDKCQKVFEYIRDLLITPLLIQILMANEKFRVDSDTSKTATGGALFHFQQGQWIHIGYRSKKLPQAVHNYGITKVELIGLICNINGLSQLFALIF